MQKQKQIQNHYLFLIYRKKTVKTFFYSKLVSDISATNIKKLEMRKIQFAEQQVSDNTSKK